MTPQSGHKRSPDPNNSYRSRSQIPRPVLAPAVAPERAGAHGLALSSRSAASGGPNPLIRLNFTLKSTAFNRRPSPGRRRLRPASPSRFSTGRRLRFPNRRPRRRRSLARASGQAQRRQAGKKARPTGPPIGRTRRRRIKTEERLRRGKRKPRDCLRNPEIRAISIQADNEWFGRTAKRKSSPRSRRRRPHSGS
jgi:hypothetical protein